MSEQTLSAEGATPHRHTGRCYDFFGRENPPVPDCSHFEEHVQAMLGLEIQYVPTCRCGWRGEYTIDQQEAEHAGRVHLEHKHGNE